MLTQLGLRLLPCSCLVTGKGKWESGQPNNVKPDPAEPTETCLGFNVLQPAELRTTAGRGESDSVFKSSMPGARTQSRSMGSVSPDFFLLLM